MLILMRLFLFTPEINWPVLRGKFVSFSPKCDVSSDPMYSGSPSRSSIGCKNLLPSNTQCCSSNSGYVIQGEQVVVCTNSGHLSDRFKYCRTVCFKDLHGQTGDLKQRDRSL